MVVATRLLLGWRQKRLAFFISLTLLHPCYILLQCPNFNHSLSRYTLLHPDYDLLCPVTPCYNPVTPCYINFTPCYTPSSPPYTLLHSVTTHLHPHNTMSHFIASLASLAVQHDYLQGRGIILLLCDQSPQCRHLSKINRTEM